MYIVTGVSWTYLLLSCMRAELSRLSNMSINIFRNTISLRLLSQLTSSSSQNLLALEESRWFSVTDSGILLVVVGGGCVVIVVLGRGWVVLEGSCGVVLVLEGMCEVLVLEGRCGVVVSPLLEGGEPEVGCGAVMVPVEEGG